MSAVEKVAQDPEQENVRECNAYRPGTMGYQFCWRPEGHEGMHRCQGYPMYSDWSDVEIRRHDA